MRKIGTVWTLAVTFSCSSGGGSGATDAAAGTDSKTATDTATPSDVVEPVGLKAVGNAGSVTGWLDGVATPIDVGVELTATVRLRRLDGTDLVGATTTVDFIHTGMGHGGAKTPEVTEVGGGAYTVTGVLPSMAGEWALSLSVSVGDFTDTLTWSVEAAK